MPTASAFRDRSGQILFLLGLALFFAAIATGHVDISVSPGRLPSLRFGAPPPGLFDSAEFAALAVSSLVLAAALPVLNPVAGSLLALAAFVAPVLINYADPGGRALIPMEFGLLTVFLLFTVNILISYFRELHSKHRIVGIFGQYVPPQVVAEISRHPERISLDGEARHMTVSFCDLKNFSSAAEQLNPRQLALMLNEYFTAMTEILYRYEGTIDKYIGDSVMAFWGAPLPKEDHARRAVQSAFDMQKEIRVLSERFTRRGWPALSMGIGINTGMMNVGNMGSKYRIAYTVVGDAVNLAARLETLTRIYRVPCIVSRTTMEETEGILFRELDVVQVKGKHKKTGIYEPVCRDEEADRSVHEQLEYHGEAINSYYEGQWDKAGKLFRFLAENHPDDGFYAYMLDRIAGEEAS